MNLEGGITQAQDGQTQKLAWGFNPSKPKPAGPTQ